jgi:hypothetical protein
MPTVSKALFRGAASTSSITLYTVPSATTAIVTDIFITNTTGSAQTATINLNGVALISGASIPANDSLSIALKQAISATQTITGSSGSTSVNFHISGVEIS